MKGPIQPVGMAAVLTPPGRGAVAVIAASGPAASDAVDRSFRAANGKLWPQQEVGRIVLGDWIDPLGFAEELIVVRCDADSLEVHCHGGVAATDRILATMRAGGCKVVDWRAWSDSQRACPVQQEAAHALASASTLKAAAVLLDQLDGALRTAVERITAAVESERPEEARRGLQALLERASLGLHLTRRRRVAIAGLPNVGKSSLINALAGYERAIIFDLPGTTRDVLTVDTAIDGWPVRLIDAAGARATDDPLEAAGVQQAVEQMLTADLVIWVLDAAALSAPQRNAPQAVADGQMHDILGQSFPAQRRLLVLNKVDLLQLKPAAGAHEAALVSALKRRGIEQLLSGIAARLAPDPTMPGDAVPFTTRQLDLLQQAMTALQAMQSAAAIAALRRILAK